LDAGAVWVVTWPRRASELVQRRGRHLFAVNGEPVTAADVNTRLAELTGEHITAKDFRTWQGTLVAFRHLRGELDSERPPAFTGDRSPPTSTRAGFRETTIWTTTSARCSGSCG
jgi:hypothetical protein